MIFNQGQRDIDINSLNHLANEVAQEFRASALHSFHGIDVTVEDLQEIMQLCVEIQIHFQGTTFRERARISYGTALDKISTLRNLIWELVSRSADGILEEIATGRLASSAGRDEGWLRTVAVGEPLSASSNHSHPYRIADAMHTLARRFNRNSARVSSSLRDVLLFSPRRQPDIVSSTRHAALVATYGEGMHKRYVRILVPVSSSIMYDIERGRANSFAYELREKLREASSLSDMLWPCAQAFRFAAINISEYQASMAVALDRALAEEGARGEAQRLANEKAGVLLESYLSPVQLRQWKRKRMFACQGGSTGRFYIVNNHRNINVTRVDRLGLVVEKLCAVPVDDEIPLNDHLLGVKMLIESDEERYLSIAIPYHARFGDSSDAAVYKKMVEEILYARK